MAKITIEELSGSLKEYLNGLGLTEAQVQGLIDKFEDEKIGDISQLSTEEKESLVGAINEVNQKANKEVDLSNYQQKTDNSLQTSSKNLVGAINELFQNANNGKELIASAIGEPLSSSDTFSAMSNDINGLLSQFKTNMMKNGITIESGDKFKSLIDKIATMVEEGSGKGVQIVSGVIPKEEIIVNVTNQMGSFFGVIDYYVKVTDLTFKPQIIVISPMDIEATNSADSIIYGMGVYTGIGSDVSYHYNGYCYDTANGGYPHGRIINSFEEDNADNSLDNYVDETGFKLIIVEDYAGTPNLPPTTDHIYYAIGVGEEDTTLRDSLASILENKGVDVTEEDDMASLITKVEQKLDESSNYLLKNGGDPSIYTINYDYASGNATATHKTNYLQFSTSGSSYQSAFAFFTLKEEIDLTDKTMIMFDLEINGTTKYTYFAYGVYKGTLDNNTTFVKGNKQNNKIDYESSLYEKRAKYIIDVSDCTGVHKIGLRIGTYGVYSSTLNLYNIEIV